MTRRFSFVALATVIGALVVSAPATAAPSPDTIWINNPAGRSATVSLRYGDAFTAGYTSRASQPWGFAECWANDLTILGTPNQGTYSAGDVIWSEYRSLYSGGPAPAQFDLTDPIQGLWLGGSATCRLSLVKFSGGYKTMTTLASTPFIVD